MHKQNFAAGISVVAVAFALLVLSGPAVRAGQPIIWEMGSRAELLRRTIGVGAGG